MEDNIFDITVKYDNQDLKGWVNPSAKLSDSGAPVSFHVILNDVSFGYLSYHNCTWTMNEERPAALVKGGGKEIEKHYQL